MQAEVPVTNHAQNVGEPPGDQHRGDKVADRAQ